MAVIDPSRSQRCVLVILDAGPVNSLWVADRLDLLRKINLPIIIVDAIYEELTADQAYAKDRDVKRFIDESPEIFTIRQTAFWQGQLKLRSLGLASKKNNAGELAIADFLTDEDGLDAIIRSSDDVLVIGEDMKAMNRLFRPEPRVHSLGTLGFLFGMERFGAIPSAQDIIKEIEHPSGPGRTLSMARRFAEPREGLDEPSDRGSTWLPQSPGAPLLASSVGTDGSNDELQDPEPEDEGASPGF